MWHRTSFLNTSSDTPLLMVWVQFVSSKEMSLSSVLSFKMRLLDVCNWNFILVQLTISPKAKAFKYPTCLYIFVYTSIVIPSAKPVSGGNPMSEDVFVPLVSFSCFKITPLQIRSLVWCSLSWCLFLATAFIL